MENAAKTPPIVIDKKIAEKVAKATALAKRLGPAGFEYISPPIKLGDKSKPIRRPKFNPIEAAEKNLKQVSAGFKIWLNEDLDKLKTAFKNYSTDPENKTKFASLSATIHTIKGNAPILGCEPAGMLASPLTDLLESCADYSKMKPVLTLAISSIYHAMEQTFEIDDPILLDTINVLAGLKSSCTQTMQAKQAQETKEIQAAGSASCTGGTKSCAASSCTSSINCPGTCPGSGT